MVVQSIVTNVQREDTQAVLLRCPAVQDLHGPDAIAPKSQKQTGNNTNNGSQHMI